jgi:heme-degrading monooxygenase HmoA
MFYCRVSDGTIDGDFQEVADRTMAALKPKLLEMPGFAGLYLLGDREAKKVMTAAFYDSREALDTGRQTAQGLRDNEGGDVKFSNVREYEVFANTGDKIHSGATAARAIFSQGDPAHAEKAVAMVKDVVIPQVRQFAGFEGGVWMTDRLSGANLTITLYASRDDLARGSEQAQKLREQAMADGGLELKGVTEYEVIDRVEAAIPAGAA